MPTKVGVMVGDEMFHTEHSETLPFQCSKCGAGHARYRDRTHKRPAAYCLACHAAHMRATRPAVALLSRTAQHRRSVRNQSRALVRRGILQRQVCHRCGSSNSEIHHPSYASARRVEWICRQCHLEHHRQLNRVCYDVPETRLHCAKCGYVHRRYRDRRHTIPASYCRKCHAAQMRAIRSQCRLDRLAQQFLMQKVVHDTYQTG